MTCHKPLLGHFVARLDVACVLTHNEPIGTPGERVMPPRNEENGVGVATIYVVQTEGAKQEFFKLEGR